MEKRGHGSGHSEFNDELKAAAQVRAIRVALAVKQASSRREAAKKLGISEARISQILKRLGT